MKNEIVLTGSSGFLGKKLSATMLGKGYCIRSLKREYLYLDPAGLALHLKGARAVIHLSGAVILRRWTAGNKELIYNSRVLTTKNLAEAISLLPDSEKPECFISASAIGIYQHDKLHTETSTVYSDSFLGKTVKDWEKASENLPVNVRRVVFRTGLVLDKEAIIIRKMLLPFRLGLGGRIGNGRQPFPFIHVTDLLNAYHNALNNHDFEGIYNLVAPADITNQKFTLTFSSLLKRPALTVVPGWVLRLVFGKASEVLLKSPRVIPEKLLKQGFVFNFPTIEETLAEILLHKR